MVASLGKATRNQWLVELKWVSFMIYKIYLIRLFFFFKEIITNMHRVPVSGLPNKAPPLLAPASARPLPFPALVRNPRSTQAF